MRPSAPGRRADVRRYAPSPSRYRNLNHLGRIHLSAAAGHLPFRSAPQFLHGHVERGDVAAEQCDGLDRNRDRPLPPSDPAEPSAIADDQLNFAVARSAQRAAHSPACCPPVEHRQPDQEADARGLRKAPAASSPRAESCLPTGFALPLGLGRSRVRPKGTSRHPTALPAVANTSASKAEVNGQRGIDVIYREAIVAASRGMHCSHTGRLPQMTFACSRRRFIHGRQCWFVLRHDR